MLKKLLPLFLLPIFLMWLPQPAQAQEPEGPTRVINWQELKTEKFIIVYAESIDYAEGVEAEESTTECFCGIEHAERYAVFADEVYNELTAIFEIELDIPVNLRLFPTEETYYEVNPLAQVLTGVVAHALNNRKEIAIAVPRTQFLTEEEVTNNVRHELTHLFASLLSDGKLKAGFHEGIAQYLEKPTQNAETDPALLRQVFEQNRLLTWAELDEADQVYRDPQVAYPESLGIVSFLIDRYSFPTFIEFLKATAVEPGYRSALETAYGKPADELEAEFLEYLPDYLNERWQINALYAYDLTRVTQLVERGAYTDAATELTDIIALLETTDQAERLAEAESLLARAHQGQAAGALADETRLALEANDYGLTIEKGQSAIAAYEALAYRDRIPELQLYVQHAQVGQAALNQLNHGEQLLNSLNFFEAESEIYEATILLQSLQNETAAQRGQELLNQSASKQSLLAYAVLIVGLAILLFNGLRRIIIRFTANPLEVEFT